MGGRKSKTLINVWSLCSMLYTRLADVGYGTKVVKNLCIIDCVLHLGVTFCTLYCKGSFINDVINFPKNFDLSLPNYQLFKGFLLSNLQIKVPNHTPEHYPPKENMYAQ